MPPQLTKVGDLTVAVERAAPAGSAQVRKPPVLLIHGMFCGAWVWEGYQALFARHGYETHAVNLRGHYGSRPVRDIGKVSVSDYVYDALEVARALGNPVVVGHSMGGLIAQKVAEAGVGRAVVLIASAPPRWIPVASWRLARRQLKYTRQLLLHEPLLPDRDDADDLIFNRTPVADREKFFPMLTHESGKAGFEMTIGRFAVRPWRVTAPALVVSGGDDHFIVPRIARAIARKYNAKLREYDTFAHQMVTEPGWEKPCSDIIEWLNGVGGARA